MAMSESTLTDEKRSPNLDECLVSQQVWSNKRHSSSACHWAGSRPIPQCFGCSLDSGGPLQAIRRNVISVRDPYKGTQDARVPNQESVQLS